MYKRQHPLQCFS